MRFHSSYIIQFFLAVALFFGLTACSGDNVLADASSEYITVGTTVDIDGTAVTKSIPVEANCSWVVVSDVDWIQITTPSDGHGNGNQSIVFNAKSNPLSGERTGHLTISTPGGITRTVNVIQRKGDIVLNIDKESLEYSFRSDDKTLIITSNTEWTATSSETWLKIEGKSQYSANGDKTLTIHADKNDNTDERKASITFTWTGNDNKTQTKTLAVTSGGNTPSLIAVSSERISAKGGTGTITVLANYEWTASITQGNSWAKFKDGNKILLNRSDGKYFNGDEIDEEIIIEPNYEDSERTLEITIQLNGKNVEQKVTITQAVGELLSIPSANFDSQTKATFTFTIASTSFAEEYGILYSTNKDYVKQQNPIQAPRSENGIVSVTIDNLQLNQTYYIYAYAKDAKDRMYYSKQPLIYEHNTNVSLQVSPSSLFFSSNGGDQFLTVIPSNTKWKAFRSATWLKIDGTNEISGEGTKQLTIHADKNTETNDQTAIITIVAEKDETIYKQVEVTLGSTTAQLSATSSSEPVSAQGGAGKIYVRSNYNWTATISGDVSWARFKNGNKTFNGGANGSAEEVEITMDENTTGSARTLTIEVKNDANLTKTVTLQQNSSTTKPGRDDNKVPDNPQ